MCIWRWSGTTLGGLDLFAHKTRQSCYEVVTKLLWSWYRRLYTPPPQRGMAFALCGFPSCGLLRGAYLGFVSKLLLFITLTCDFVSGFSHQSFNFWIDIFIIKIFFFKNVASNNFGNHYINGILVFGDLDQGDGHGADYWNNEVQVYTNYLSQGENIIASVVGNPTNAQWFDQEIELSLIHIWRCRRRG